MSTDAGLRTPINGNERGFTLVEILVVILIIGVLAAIAIPTFVAQRKRAFDAAMQSDLHQVATAQEALRADGEPLLAGVPASVDLSDSVNVSVALDGAGLDYCLVATSPRGSHAWVWIGSAGGLQAGATTVCPAGF